MRNKKINNLVLGIVLIVSFSCKKNESNRQLNNSIQKDLFTNDTIIITDGIYLLSPNVKEIDSLKKSIGEEDFYTIADDSNFYISEIFNSLKNKIKQIKFNKINFEKEHFNFSKKSSNLSWLVIDYKEGSKPKIYSLVDFYGSLTKKKLDLTTDNINLYLDNKDYINKSFDINNDDQIDKVFSSKPNTGDKLLIYLNENNNYSLVLNTTNFSQDGGNQITDILKNENGIILETDSDKGLDKYQYFIVFKNNNFILEK